VVLPRANRACSWIWTGTPANPGAGFRARGAGTFADGRRKIHLHAEDESDAQGLPIGHSAGVDFRRAVDIRS
jgi:hypothetical protein